MVNHLSSGVEEEAQLIREKEASMNRANTPHTPSTDVDTTPARNTPMTHHNKTSARKGAGEVTEVIDRLYLSGFRAVRPNRLAELGVNLVVNATVELPTLAMDGVEVLAVRISDNGKSDLYSELDEAVDRIHSIRRHNGRVLVHCVAGVSRSPAVILAYLVKHGGMTLRDAFQHVRRLRPNARPNSGFFAQLIEFERRILGSASVSVIVDEETGLSIPDVCEEELQMIRDKRLARMISDRRNFQRVYA